MELLTNLFKPTLFLLFSIITNPLFIIIIVIAIVFLFVFNYLYKKSSYYKVTKLPYLSVRSDTGRYGEYLIYQKLKHYENDNVRFLFNVYLPKSSEETTEIDVLLICSHGVFVIESKNYSGWIFGDENSFQWTQTLPNGNRSKKEHFYNPIKQNETHIKSLKSLIGDDIPTHSIIAFSERCTLKNVNIESTNIRVINRYDIESTVNSICQEFDGEKLPPEQIKAVYDKLYPYTQVDDELKKKHIEQINNKKGKF